MRKLLEDNGSNLGVEPLNEQWPEPMEEPAILPSCLHQGTLMQPLQKLIRYVRDRNYEGIDLFDGLNSLLFKFTPLYQSRLFRLALIQFCKLSPINFRPLLLVKGGFNPKAGALFLMGNLNLFRSTGQEVYANDAYILFQRLKHIGIPRKVGLGWGYNFDWQARAFFVPQGTPNMVTSVYVGRALLDYHHQFNDAEALQMAIQISAFILDEMIQYEDVTTLCFNYIPGQNAEVHNANLLAASYLAQVLPYVSPERQAEMRQKVLKSTRFSVEDIKVDGAWPYGTKPFHRWVDNFHTGFNIESLVTISVLLETDEFIPILMKVLEYYLMHLFTEEGIPKYYNQSVYPIDVHVLAEAIVVFQLLRNCNMAWFPVRILKLERAMLDLVDVFQDPEKGYFYYQKTYRSWNKISYMRWGQAWMFYALSSCL